MDDILCNPIERKICEQLITHLHVWRDRHLETKTQADEYTVYHYIPTAMRVAKVLAPSSPVTELAALAHEMGRIGQMFARGHFNDGPPHDSTDHHEIGARIFYHEAHLALYQTGEISETDFDASVKHGVIYQVSQAILLHGRQYNPRFTKEFAALDLKTLRLIELITKIAEVTEGTQSPRYFLYEAQYDLRRVSLGGSITDPLSTRISPEIMHKLLYLDTDFHPKECHTYAEYAVYQTYLVAKSLHDPATREITKRLLKEKTIVFCVPRPGAKHQLREIRRYPDVLGAYAYIYNQLVEWELSGKLQRILNGYFRSGSIKPTLLESQINTG